MMEGGWQRPFGTTLLLLCMFVPSLVLMQDQEEPQCKDHEYLSETGICCNKCSEGYKLVAECQAVNHRSICEPCPADQYINNMNYSPNCIPCRRCKTTKHEVEVSKCERNRNTICRCEEGFYKFPINSVTSECRRCKQCGRDEKINKTCTKDNDTVCECKEDYYRLRRECVPCTTCSTVCNSRCPTSPVADPDNRHGYLVNFIAVVVVVAVVIVALVVPITHHFTKRITKKKLLKSSPTSDDSLDSIEALYQTEEPSANDSVKAEPHSVVIGQEAPSLPDCVPLEIKTPHLIYTLLDIMPVQQVKQLARSLGVSDTAIERAEMDHRCCKEAHYQMLRVWAEHGSQAGGGGGRGRMLPLTLLQELLDKLREMHLGWAAEELETKYSIQ